MCCHHCITSFSRYNKIPHGKKHLYVTLQRRHARATLMLTVCYALCVQFRRWWLKLFDLTFFLGATSLMGIGAWAGIEVLLQSLAAGGTGLWMYRSIGVVVLCERAQHLTPLVILIAILYYMYINNTIYLNCTDKFYRLYFPQRKTQQVLVWLDFFVNFSLHLNNPVAMHLRSLYAVMLSASNTTH